MLNIIAKSILLIELYKIFKVFLKYLKIWKQIKPKMKKI